MKTRASAVLFSCLFATIAAAAPVLTLPTSPMKAFSPTAAGGTVSFIVTATDSIDGIVTPTATPPSGSAFPVGDTTVNVTATNSLGQTTTGSFVVRVAQSVLTTVDFYRLGETENGVAGANFASGIDAAGGNNTLTAGSGVTYSTNVGTPVGLNGQSTMCANFASGNGGLVGQFFNSSFQIDNFGVECFVTADGTDGVVVANRNPSSGGWTIHKSGTEWWVTWDGNRARVLAATVSIGTRVHLALVRENGIARLFVNGTSVGSTNRGMNNPGGLAHTEIGGTFTGRIDEVRYFTFTGGTFTANELLVNSAIASTVTNNAPTITSNGGGATASINVAENTTAVTTVVATDTDTPAQTITYSKSGTNAALFNIDSSTGALAFAAAPDFETNAGPFSVTVTATDNGAGTLSDSQDLTINVTNVNEMPSFTKGADESKPYGTNNVQILEGWATAIDDGDSTVTQALTFNITGNTNAGMFLSAPVIDSAGTLTYRPNGTSGTATISVTLTDDASINGTAALTTATQQFTITVAPQPITVTSVSPSVGSTAGGTSVTITGTAFIGATSVTFGGTAATGVTVVNSTTITCTTPTGTAGAASVVVTTPSGSNAANTLYTFVNSAPAGTDKSITVAQSSTYTFMDSDWGFSDTNDSPPNNFSAVKLTTLPSAGTLQVDGVNAVANQVVSRSGGPAGAAWTARESDRLWFSIASSADGLKLAAVVAGGQIYTSTDGGVNWTARESNRSWYSVASSTDGTKLVAVANAGLIYTSTDSGVNWTPRDSNRAWYGVASSADGTKLAAVVENGQIYTSTDSGTTWTPRESNRRWRAIASSADGTKLVAGDFGGQLYTSTDSGVNWTARESDRNWNSVASSADGTKLVAVESAVNGHLYTSTDSGATWTVRASTTAWYAVASSADGTRLVAGAEGPSLLATSTDSGVTWTTRDSNRRWLSVASSADGTRLVAGDFQGKLYTSVGSPAVISYTAPSTEGSQSFTFQVQDDGVMNNLDLSPKTITFIIANQMPVIAANNGTTTVASGSAANTGTFSDPDGNATVTLSATSGTVTKDNAGTWSWTESGITKSKLVTITGTDGALSATVTFAAQVDGVYPFAVSNTGDTGAGSLREAIAGAASKSKSVIDMSSVNGTVTLTTALPAINGDVQIVGPSDPATLTITRDANAPDFNHFNVGAGQKLTLSGVTISNGKAVNGGAISNHNGSIDVSHCVFTNNTATNTGGAIYNLIDGAGHTCVINLHENAFSGNTGIISGIATKSSGADQHVTFTSTDNTFAHGVGIDETEFDGTTGDIAASHADEDCIVTFAGSGAGTFSFHNTDATQWSTFNVLGTSAADAISISGTTFTLGTETVAFAGSAEVFLNAGLGADTITVTNPSESVPLTLNAGTDGGSFSLTTTDYASNISLVYFTHVDLQCSNFTGVLNSDTTVQNIIIDNDCSGSISAAGFDSIDIGGELSGVITSSPGAEITSLACSTLAETGKVKAGSIGDFYVWGDLLGSVYVAHPGTIRTLYVGASLRGSVTLVEDYPNLTTGVLESLDAGEVSSTGSIYAGRINNVKVAGDMAGSITTAGAGVLQNFFATSVSGTVKAIEDITVNGVTTITGGGAITTSANADLVRNATRQQIAYNKKLRNFFIVNDNQLKRLDLNGNIVWTKALPSPLNMVQVVLDNSGNPVVVGTEMGVLNRVYVAILSADNGNTLNFADMRPSNALGGTRGFIDGGVGMCVDPSTGDIALCGYSFGSVTWNSSATPKTGLVGGLAVALPDRPATGQRESYWVCKLSSALNLTWFTDLGYSGRSAYGIWDARIIAYVRNPGETPIFMTAFNGPGTSFKRSSKGATEYTNYGIVMRSIVQSTGVATAKPMSLKWQAPSTFYSTTIPSNVTLYDLTSDGTNVLLTGNCSGDSYTLLKDFETGSDVFNYVTTMNTGGNFQQKIGANTQFPNGPFWINTYGYAVNGKVNDLLRTVKFGGEYVFTSFKTNAAPGTIAIDDSRDVLYRMLPGEIEVYDATGTKTGSIKLTSNTGSNTFKAIARNADHLVAIGVTDKGNGNYDGFMARFENDMSLRSKTAIPNVKDMFSLCGLGDGSVLVAGTFGDSLSVSGKSITGKGGYDSAFVIRYNSDNSIAFLANPSQPTNQTYYPLGVAVDPSNAALFYLFFWESDGKHQLIMCSTSDGSVLRTSAAYTAPSSQPNGGLVIGVDGKPTVYGMFKGTISTNGITLSSNADDTVYSMTFQNNAAAASSILPLSGQKYDPGQTSLNKVYTGVAQLIGVSTTGRIGFLATQGTPGKIVVNPSNGNVFTLGKEFYNTDGRNVDALYLTTPSGDRSTLFRSSNQFLDNLPAWSDNNHIRNVYSDPVFNSLTYSSDGCIYIVGSVAWERNTSAVRAPSNPKGGIDYGAYVGKRVGFILRFSPFAYQVYNYSYGVEMLWRDDEVRETIVDYGKWNGSQIDRYQRVNRPAFDEPTAVAVSGNFVYVAGTFTCYGGLKSGSTLSAGAGDSVTDKAFIVKLNKPSLPTTYNARSGNATAVWENAFDSLTAGNYERIANLVVDSNGNAFVAATRNLTDKAATTILGQACLFKYDATTGSQAWVAQDISANKTAALATYVDPNNAPYFLMRASGSTAFGGKVFNFNPAATASANRLTRISCNAGTGSNTAQIDLGSALSVGNINGTINGATIQAAAVGGSLTGTIKAAGQGAIGFIEINGDLTGSVSALIDDTPGSGSINNLSVGGTLNGSVNSTALTTLNAPNVSPTATIIGGSGVNIAEGGIATNGGKFSTLDAATMTITANFGTVTKGSGGVWNWTMPVTDGPATQSITVTGTDSNGNTESTNFDLSINNIEPSISLSGNSNVDQLVSYSLNLGSITDPGNDTVSSYTIQWGDGESETVSGTPSGSRTHLYSLSGPMNISVSLTDEDGSYANVGIKTITVNDTGATISTYEVTTTGGVLTITKNNGSNDTLNLAEGGANALAFNAPGRVFIVDGQAISGGSGDLDLSGISGIVVNGGDGNNVINVGDFSQSLLPSLTVNGGTGNDEVHLNGTINFAPNASLDIDLQNDGGNPGTDRITLGTHATIVMPENSTGDITLKASRDIVLPPGSSIQAGAGDITLAANQQATPTSGDFTGISGEGASITSQGAGAITIQGRGGNAGNGNATAPNSGIRLSGTQITLQGEGALNLQGTSVANGDNAAGIVFNNSNASTSGDITINAAAIGSGDGDNRPGIILSGDQGASIKVEGTGELIISASGAPGSGDGNNGIVVAGTAALSVTDGIMSLVGEGSDAGIVLQGTLQSTGNGDIALDGTGSVGIEIDGSQHNGGSPVISTEGSDVTIAGSSTSGGDSVQLDSSGAALVTTDNGGDIAVIGDKVQVLDTTGSGSPAIDSDGSLNLQSETPGAPSPITFNSQVYSLISTSDTVIVNSVVTNHAPSALSVSNTSLDENNVAGFNIGALSFTDPDSGQTPVFSFAVGAGDTDNGLFSIVGNSLQASTSLDADARADYSVRLNVTDGHGGTFQRIVTIHVNDIADTPSQLWKQQYFGSFANSGKTADTASFTGDGIPNLVKFAFSVSPLINSPGALRFNGNIISPGGITTGHDNTGAPIAEWVRRKDSLSVGLNYTVQFSADLTTWEADATAPAVLADDGTNQVVGLNYPLMSNGAQAKFFRVMVSQ